MGFKQWIFWRCIRSQVVVRKLKLLKKQRKNVGWLKISATGGGELAKENSRNNVIYWRPAKTAAPISGVIHPDASWFQNKTAGDTTRANFAAPCPPRSRDRYILICNKYKHMYKKQSVCKINKCILSVTNKLYWSRPEQMWLVNIVWKLKLLFIDHRKYF